MAHFYGTIQGARGQASRLGHKATGLRAVAASYSGAVDVQLYVNSAGIDCARVALKPWHGAGRDAVLYDGPIGNKHEHIGVGHCPVCNHYGRDCTGKKKAG
jgi:hypothetical protein